MTKETLLNWIRENLKKYLDELDLEIWNLDYKKEGKKHKLKLFIDKKDLASVGIDDCESVANYLSHLLDEENLIDESYDLEVASPGLDRELFRDKDFEIFKNSIVEVKTYTKILETKQFDAILLGTDNENIILKVEDKEISIARDAISKINLKVIF